MLILPAPPGLVGENKLQPAGEAGEPLLSLGFLVRAHLCLKFEMDKWGRV